MHYLPSWVSGFQLYKCVRAEENSTASLSFFLSLSVSLFPVSLSQSEQQRPVSQAASEAGSLFGWDRETRTPTETVKNPSNTPSRIQTQMVRKWQEVISLPSTPFLCALLPSSTNPGCSKQKRAERRDAGSVYRGRMTEMVSNYSFGMSRQAGSNSSPPPPPSVVWSTDGLCTDNRVMWLSVTGAFAAICSAERSNSGQKYTDKPSCRDWEAAHTRTFHIFSQFVDRELIKNCQNYAGIGKQ